MPSTRLLNTRKASLTGDSEPEGVSPRRKIDVHKDHLPTWFLPELKLSARPALLVLATLLLVGLAAVLKHWQPSPRAESAGFDLLAGSPSPKLDITSAETPESQSVPAFAREAENTESGPEQPTRAIPVGNVSSTQDIPAPDAAAELQLPDSSGPYKMPDLAAETPKVETAEAVPMNEFSAPQVFDEETFRNSQRGETPMIRNWKMLGLQTVLAAALAAAPSPTYALDDQTQNKEGKSGGKNSDTKEPSLADLKKSLDTIKKDLDSLRADILNSKLATSGEIEKLKNQVVRLQADLDALRNRPASSTSLYGPRPAGTGHIRLENTYPGEIAVVINQTRYPLAQGQTLTLAVPAGPFSYQVLNRPDLGIRNRDVLPNETFSITVYPQ